jgi:4-diphosphocytidyl-2-C-methyl-D-erythritol kinase
VISFPNGKINIGLKIIRKRPDAYHDLETIFYPIPLSDILEFVAAPSLSFNSYGQSIPGENLDNICVSAYKLLKGEFPSLSPIAIHLLKNIPVAAGLGGGSSDAGFMLKMLNDYFRLGISEVDLCMYASKLGSDCAFFIRNMPCFASGRGEILEPVELDLSPYSLVLVKTDIHISTGWAFTKIKASGEPSGLRHSFTLPITEWKNTIKNDFEEPVFRTYPLLRKIKQRLYEAGSLYASMSGSGSCLYGVFKKNSLPRESVFSDLSSEIYPMFIP